MAGIMAQIAARRPLPEAGKPDDRDELRRGSR
jgi:hypothetical protein